MHLRYLPVFVLMSTLVLVGAGCGQKPATSTTEPSGTTSKPSTTTKDACGNPYYPFKPGLTIAYGVSPTTGEVSDSDYTFKVVSVSGTTANIRIEMAEGATTDMTADCSSGSVALNGSSNLGAAMAGVQFKTTVLSSEGTYMPANVSSGTAWENKETVKMEFTGGQMASVGPVTMTTTVKSKAVSEESVTVPAGTYKAMKVEGTVTSSGKMDSGMTLPSETVKTTEWWVKGIGMVKSVTESDGETSTVEAKSITGA